MEFMPEYLPFDPPADAKNRNCWSPTPVGSRRCSSGMRTAHSARRSFSGW